MEMTYMVSGNNIFGQWICETPILEQFMTVTKQHSNLSHEINLNCADLVCICWSYNIFKFRNVFYLAGDWAGNAGTIRKIDITEEYNLNATNLLSVGNDFNLVIIDIKKLKIWVVSLTEKLEIIPKEPNFELLLSKEVVKKRRRDIEIIKAVATNTTFLYLTNEGYVYQGMSPTHLDTSHCLGEVCDVDCGYNHCMLLTDAGRIYTWGSSERLQLGHGDIRSVSTPTEVEALAGLKIKKIATGGFHSLALSVYGDLYAWGWNDTGQLGINSMSETNEIIDGNKTYPLPTLVDIFDEKGRQVELDVVDIACGSRHTAIKLADNTIWASGYNKYGQLGLSPKTHPTVEHFSKVYDCDYDYKLICGIWSTVLVRRVGVAK